MEKKLKGKKIAVLTDRGADRFAMKSIHQLKAEGALVSLIIRERRLRRIKEGSEVYEYNVSADDELKNIKPELYDALLISGDITEIDNLRLSNAAVDFVKHFLCTHKPIATNSYGALLLMEADGIKDKEITSDPYIESDFLCAGAKWIDAEVVADENIITTKGNLFEEFAVKMLEVFSQQVSNTEPVAKK